MGYYAETKVYFDGSHYVGIPNQKELYDKRRKHRRFSPEKKVYVDKDNKVIKEITEPIEIKCSKGRVLTKIEFKGTEMVPVMKKKEGIRAVSKKETFEEAYKKYYGYNKREMRKNILEEMSYLFKDRRSLEDYIDNELRKKKKNLCVRKTRCFRKAYLQEWNYFVTITYDSEKQTEESFRKKLLKTLANFSTRKKWKYIGVFERGEETGRLHFHCILSVKENTLPGEMKEIKDYDVKGKQMQTIHSNSYFQEKFGRNDFSIIDSEYGLDGHIDYLLKYIEKSEERLVYSRHLPTFFISDILDEDIVGTYGEYEGLKLVLFDCFRCIDMGEIIGEVSREIIQTKMRYAY